MSPCDAANSSNGSVKQAVEVAFGGVADREQLSSFDFARRCQAKMHPATVFVDDLIEVDGGSGDGASDVKRRTERRAAEIGGQPNCVARSGYAPDQAV